MLLVLGYPIARGIIFDTLMVVTSTLISLAGYLFAHFGLETKIKTLFLPILEINFLESLLCQLAFRNKHKDLFFLEINIF